MATHLLESATAHAEQAVGIGELHLLLADIRSRGFEVIVETLLS